MTAKEEAIEDGDDDESDVFEITPIKKHQTIVCQHPTTMA